MRPEAVDSHSEVSSFSLVGLVKLVMSVVMTGSGAPGSVAGDLATVETQPVRVHHWACLKLLSLPLDRAGRASYSSERAS